LSTQENASRVQLSASGSSVDVVSIPCHFYAANYNLLEQLFVPLLSAAQQANDVMGLRSGDDQAALRGAAYLAGELLRDKSFAPARSLMTSVSHAFLIDLPGNSFQAETVVNAVGSKASMFILKVMGAIRGDKFMVVEPSTNNTLFSFTRFEADKPEFFVRDFPFLAQEARQDPTMFSGAPSALVHGVIDLVLSVPVAEKAITVRVHKEAGTVSVEVKHPITNETVFSLPLASLNNIGKLVETIAQHLVTNPKAAALFS
jgi:hypothetical protein